MFICLWNDNYFLPAPACLRTPAPEQRSPIWCYEVHKRVVYSMILVRCRSVGQQILKAWSDSLLYKILSVSIQISYIEVPWYSLLLENGLFLKWCPYNACSFLVSKRLPMPWSPELALDQTRTWLSGAWCEPGLAVVQTEPNQSQHPGHKPLRRHSAAAPQTWQNIIPAQLRPRWLPAQLRRAAGAGL